MERINELLSTYKYPLILSFVGIVLVIGGLASQGLLASKPSKNYPQESIVKQTNQKISSLKVDVSGAVVLPGVYEMDSEDRIEQVIEKAGGFADEANEEFIAKSLNLSQRLSDGQKIYIPFRGENTGGVVAGIAAEVNNQTSINNASQKELEALPSIGAVSALKIIENRPYQSIDDLTTKKVITKTVFKKIQSLIKL